MTLILDDRTAPAVAPRELVSPALFDRLVRRIVKDEQIDQPTAERIVAQALGFLQACALNPGAGLSPSPKVDIGWHTFVLHTKDYAKARELHQTGEKSQVASSGRRSCVLQRYYELAV
jgi:hypothetical protein